MTDLFAGALAHGLAVIDSLSDEEIAAAERRVRQDALDHAILYGDDMDVLQAFGDPGDGDLADYL